MIEITKDFILILSIGTFLLMMPTSCLVIKIAKKMGIKIDD